MAKRQKYPVAVAERDDIHIKHLIKAKTPNQAEYLDSLRSKRLVFGIGPAGTGKSFLATAVGLEKLLNNEVAKIIICRPAVEAGEKLGFLPGTMEEKITPFLRPIIDAIEDHVGIAKAKQLMTSGKIEFATLAHMRGRTLNDCLTADHTVLLSSGEHMRIDELVDRFDRGESIEVLSYNLETQEVEKEVISYAFRQPTEAKLVKFTLADGTILKVTKDHKLYVKDKGYVPAGLITAEDELLQLE